MSYSYTPTDYTDNSTAVPISAANLDKAENAIAALHSEKLDLAGGTMTGLLTLGTGDLVQQYNTALAGSRLDVRRGTSASPDRTLGALVKVQRTMDTRQSDITGGGIGGGASAMEELAAIEGVAIGSSTMEAQPVGVVGMSKNNSTTGPAGGAGNDALGLHGTGRITGTGNGVGIGLAAYGRKDSTSAKVSGVECGSLNYTGVSDSHTGNNFDASHALWMICGGTADSATGLLMGNPFSRQFDVGIGIISQNGGPVKTASFRDAGSALTSLLIKGTHTTAAMAVGAGSGPVLIGLETAISASTLLEVRKTGAADPLVDYNSSASDSQSIRLRNSAGAMKWFVAGSANSFLTGTAAGDTGLLAGSATKIMHFGGSVSVMSINNDNTLLFRGGATTFGTMDPSTGRLSWERQIGYNPRTTVFEQDHFVGGGQTAGQIGKLNWQLTNATYASQGATAAGRAGIGRVSSSTTANQVCSMYLRAAVNTGAIWSGDLYTIEWWVRPVESDGNTIFRVGIGIDSSASPPTHGAYFEKLAGDTQWFPVSRAASSETRGANMGTVSTANWVRMKIRRAASSVFFSIDGGAETEITTTVSNNQAFNPFIQAITTTTTVRRIDVDYCEFLVQGLTS